MSKLSIKYSMAVRSSKPGTKKEDITETQAYPVLQLNGIYGMEDIARHIAEHGSKYHRGDIYAVLSQAVDCVAEMLSQGVKVKLGDLGSFAPSLRVKGSPTASECTSDDIVALRVKYHPSKYLTDLRSECSFEAVPSRKGAKDALTAERAKETLQPEPEESGNGGNSIE